MNSERDIFYPFSSVIFIEMNQPLYTVKNNFDCDLRLHSVNAVFAYCSFREHNSSDECFLLHSWVKNGQIYDRTNVTTYNLHFSTYSALLADYCDKPITVNLNNIKVPSMWWHHQCDCYSLEAAHCSIQLSNILQVVQVSSKYQLKMYGQLTSY